MLDPEAKPKTIEYTIVRAFTVVTWAELDGSNSAAGNHRVMVVAPQRANAAIILLNRPSLSAMYPGAHRPRHEPAFMNAMRLYAKSVSIAPVDMAKEGMYAIGTNRPHSIHQVPAVNQANAGSRKIRKSGITDCPGLGGNRDRVSRTAMVQQNMKTNPMIRVAQANPTRGKSCCNIRGKIIPPREPPAAAMPVAFPRFSRKKWPTAEIQGVKRRDVPTPPRRLKTRMKCQYSVQD